MAQVKVTVNGRPVDVWVDEEENQEIYQFYASELRSMKKLSHRPMLTHQPIKNVTRPVAAANNSVRFA